MAFAKDYQEHLLDHESQNHDVPYSSAPFSVT